MGCWPTCAANSATKEVVFLRKQTKIKNRKNYLLVDALVLATVALDWAFQLQLGNVPLSNNVDTIRLVVVDLTVVWINPSDEL